MFGGFAARPFPEGCMSIDSAEKRQAFERWVSALRTGTASSPGTLGEDSGVVSLDAQKTLVQHLPKDVVRRLRERTATHRLPADDDSTAIFDAPPELLARARRLVPPKKPERSATPSTPPEPLAEARPTPVVTAQLPEEAVALAELHQLPLPPLSDASEWEDAPVAVPAPPVVLASASRRTARLGWT